MKLSVYLSHEIYQVLSCYGNLNDVVNNILDAGSQDIIDIMQKPAAPDKKGGTYYDLDIRNEDYIQLVETYGVKSSKISMRRLLYWFVENEVYNDLGWELKESYVDEKDNKKLKVISELKQSLFKFGKIFPEYRHLTLELKTELNKIEEDLWYAE